VCDEIFLVLSAPALSSALVLIAFAQMILRSWGK
jgi:hypothetical protein